MLYAHTPPAGSDDWHELGEHLDTVACLAAKNAAKFGGGEVARWAGRWHDIGKANPKFQEYLEHCFREGGRSGRSVGHKGAGVLAVRNADRHVSALAYLIQGHHGGLPNTSDLKARIKSLKDDAEAIAGYAAAERAGLLDFDDPSPGREIFPPFLFDESGRLIPAKLAFFPSNVLFRPGRC